MSEAMMNENRLPFKCWGEVVNTVVYIPNRCPTRVLDNSTPFEAFKGLWLYMFLSCA